VGALIISEQKFEALLTFDVPSIAAGDCVLFLWATAPMEAQAHEVMTAWGFTYVTQVIWDKNADGHGYWFINRHETLLVGKKGKVPAPAPGTQQRSVIKAFGQA
jgi:N6-adenosine-specific RNA methylase IME4